MGVAPYNSLWTTDFRLLSFEFVFVVVVFVVVVFVVLVVVVVVVVIVVCRRRRVVTLFIHRRCTTVASSSPSSRSRFVCRWHCTAVHLPPPPSSRSLWFVGGTAVNLPYHTTIETANTTTRRRLVFTKALRCTPRQCCAVAQGPCAGIDTAGIRSAYWRRCQ